MKKFKTLAVSALLVASMPLTTLQTVSAAPTNLALGGSAVASNQEVVENADNSAGKAIDGDLSTRWATLENHTKETLTVALKGGSQKVKQIKIIFEDRDKSAEGTHTNVTGYKIEASTGEDQWKEVFKKESDVAQVEEITLQEVAETDQLRLTILGVEATGWQNVSVCEFEVYGEETETEPEYEQSTGTNHMKNAVVTVSSEEANTLTKDKLNDGIQTEGTTPAEIKEGRKNRWASAENENTNAWINAEFPKTTLVGEVYVNFFRDAEPLYSQVQAFDIEYVDASGQTQNVTVQNERVSGQNGYKDRVKYHFEEPVLMQSLKLKNFQTVECSWNNISIEEMEVYTDQRPEHHTLESVVASIQGMEIPTDVTTLEVPQVPEGYEVTFNGADFEQIVDADRNVHHPLVDKTVQISWNVKETASGNEKNTGDISYTVKGANTVAEGTNAKPVVIPELQEWYSDSNATLAESSLTKVGYQDPSLSAVVDEFIKDYAAFTGRTLEKAEGSGPDANMIYFEKTADLAYLGNEGYAMDIQADRIVVRSSHVTGNMYGMQTILQMYKENAESYPVGQIHDYPRFPVRGLLLDVARKPISMEMMKDITRTMRYYKMNDFQAHLNDNYIFLKEYGVGPTEDEAFKAYEAFRLESTLKNDKGETITAKDYSITKADFKKFITEERALGMNIVPEIDVPAHAMSITKVWPEYRVVGKKTGGGHPEIDHIDISKKEAVELVKDIFDDYTHDDTFDDDTIVHIGVDEFMADAKAYREFCNEFIPYIKTTNTVRMWGGFSWIKDNPLTEIKKEAIENVQMNLWSKDWADGIDMYNMGYKLINTIDQYGYMVPNGNHGRGSYQDFLNLNDVFNKFECNKVSTGHGFVPIPSGDDQALGGAYAIWSDNIDKSASGLTESDYFTRFFDGLPVYAEKTWAATGKEKGSAENLTAIAQRKGIGPNVNPYYQVSKTGEFYEKYDFASEQDLSENDRDLTDLTGAKIKDGTLHLSNGKSYVNTPIEQLGNGNTLSFDIKLEKEAKPGDILFEETAPYGTHDIRIMEDGNLGFTRELYDYEFDYVLPVGEMVNIKIVTEEETTKLYVDNMFAGTATGKFVHNGIVKKTGINNATFALPLERIGSENNAIAAEIDNVEVSVSKEIVPSIVVDKSKWKMTAETETVHDNKEGEITKAVDDNFDTHWHSNWVEPANDKVPTTDGKPGSGAGEDGTIWAEIVFDQPYLLDRFAFYPRQDTDSCIVTEASLYVKETVDSEWKQVADHETFPVDNGRKIFRFAKQKVAAVRFEAHKSDNGWVTVSEFDIRPLKEEPEKPNPNPTPDPGKPDPEKPNPEKPDPGKPNPEKPDPGKPNPEKPNPGKPNPEKPNPEKPNSGKPGTGNSSGSVQTGDATNVIFPIAGIAGAGILVGVAGYRRKRK